MDFSIVLYNTRTQHGHTHTDMNKYTWTGRRARRNNIHNKRVHNIIIIIIIMIVVVVVSASLQWSRFYFRSFYTQAVVYFIVCGIGSR